MAKRVVVLISGSGSNLEALLQAAEQPGYGVEVVGVGADRTASGLDYATSRGIPTFIVKVSDFETRQQWDQSLTQQVADLNPDLVISAGFLKLVGEDFLASFNGKYINTHNSLLPSFAGIRGPQDALEYGVKLAGATLFMVDEGVDTGIILAQVAVPVLIDDDLESLTERIKEAERAQLVNVVGNMARNGWLIEGRRATVFEDS